MDNVLVDFPSGITQLSKDQLFQYEGDLDEVPGIFSLMVPMPGSIEAYSELSTLFDTYILSTAPWENSSAWSDKINWVKKYLGGDAYKRLMISHHKNLNIGDYLIDARTRNGADKFLVEHIHYGKTKFPDWGAVLDYLRKNS